MPWEFPAYPNNWAEISEQCKARDGYRCRNCTQRSGEGIALQAHHIISKSAGGADELDNLITLCEACHAGIHPHMRSKVQPIPPTAEFLRSLATYETKYNKYAGIPTENLPLVRVDLPLDAFETTSVARSFAKLYGGYYDGISEIHREKVRTFYISKNGNPTHARDLRGLEVVRLEISYGEELEFYNNLKILVKKVNTDLKKLERKKGALISGIEELKGTIADLTEKRAAAEASLAELRKMNGEMAEKLGQLEAIKADRDTEFEQSAAKLKEFQDFARLYWIYQKKYYILIAIILSNLVFLIIGLSVGRII